MPLRLLDTDVVIDLQHQFPAAIVWFAALDLSQVAVPGFVAMELIQSARNSREAASADAIVGRLARIWPNEIAADAALVDFRRLHLSHGLGLVDALIGTTARERDAILGTFNIKHYRSVPGLNTEQPYQR
jgi:predicted nucleic acid-binding protein